MTKFAELVKIKYRAWLVTEFDKSPQKFAELEKNDHKVWLVTAHNSTAIDNDTFCRKFWSNQQEGKTYCTTINYLLTHFVRQNFLQAKNSSTNWTHKKSSTYLARPQNYLNGIINRVPLQDTIQFTTEQNLPRAVHCPITGHTRIRSVKTPTITLAIIVFLSITSSITFVEHVICPRQQGYPTYMAQAAQVVFNSSITFRSACKRLGAYGSNRLHFVGHNSSSEHRVSILLKRTQDIHLHGFCSFT